MAKKQKVYEATVTVKVVVRATSREDAVLAALDACRPIDGMASIKVESVFCPAEGK